MAAVANTEAQAPVLAPVVDAPAPTAAETKVESTEPVKESATPAPEDVAATTVVEPLKDDVNKLPTVTHAEAGTAHKETDVATNVAGEQADKPVPAAPATTEETPAAVPTAIKVDETPKEASPKKEATKEKTEKVKAEGKGFFAKLFSSSSSKSPKKPKEVKTPKAEKADPVAQPATETAAEPVAAVEAPKETEAPVAPPKDTAVVPAADEPTKVTETSAVVADTKAAEPVTETKPAVEPPVTEAGPSTAVAAAETPKTEDTKAAEPTKSPKVSRRLSARFGGFMKTLVPKKEHHEEAHKEETEAGAVKDTTPVAASEAPKIDKPEPIAPLEEPKPTTTTSTAAPAAAPAVATAA